MANKRSLKYAINLICEELLAEAIAASLYGNDQHEENADAVLFSIIRLQGDYISRISHVEAGIKPKKFFAILRENFAKEVNEVVDHIHNM